MLTVKNTWINKGKPPSVWGVLPIDQLVLIFLTKINKGYFRFFVVFLFVTFFVVFLTVRFLTAILITSFCDPIFLSSGGLIKPRAERLDRLILSCAIFYILSIVLCCLRNGRLD